MSDEIQVFDSIPLSEVKTKRPSNEGAEKWLGVPIKCLDHGFVYLVDYMGNDQAIEQAARVSYGSGTRRVSETRGLIRYLRRHDHTTPFEMCELKFHAKHPIFVARQWVRHRTANINEYSGRYSILDKEFYVPEPEVLAEQSSTNRQGRENIVPIEYAEWVRRLIMEDAETVYRHYEEFLNDDGSGKPRDGNRPRLARELARIGLSLNFYTQWYWKIDLHNFMHFSRLRLDPHAQYETKVYAEAMAQIAKDAFPLAWESFEDYELYSRKFTRLDQNLLRELFAQRGLVFTIDEVLEVAKKAGLSNRREREEAIEKLRVLGLVTS